MKYCCIATRQPRGSRENRFLIILFTASIRASAAVRDDGAEADALKLIAVIYMCSKILFPERERQGFGRGYWLSRQMHDGLCVCKCVCA